MITGSGNGTNEINKESHIGLNVLVLEVESVLPDIDTNDGDEGEERVLVSGGGDLETLGGGVQALQRKKSRTIISNYCPPL